MSTDYKTNMDGLQNGAIFFTLVTFVTTLLKMMGLISWSWWLVLIPFWGPAVTVIVLVIATMIAITKDNIKGE